VRLPESVDTPLRTIVCIPVLPPALILASLLGIVLALLGASQRRVHIAYTGYARFCLLMGATRLGVGEPISTEGLTLDDRTSLRDQTLAVVSQLREPAQFREAAQLRVRSWGVDPQCV